MSYDEERDEERRDFHISTRDCWNPDGKSTLPDCEHPKLKSVYLRYIKGLPVCPDCGLVVYIPKAKP
jgi:hypothetical protein